MSPAPRSHRPRAVSVLGIDAAWSATQPSGVALVAGEPGAWRVVACAPSYEAFLHLAQGSEVDWSATPRASAPPVEALRSASRSLTGREPEVVAVDMPLARGPVRARRRADDEVSRRFGAAQCSTHSPTPERPGRLADDLRRDWARAGLDLATTATEPGALPALLEVYPHVALLELCEAPTRLPYKLARSLRYWPGTSVVERIERLLAVWRGIAAGLQREFGPLACPLPAPAQVRSLSQLKRFEDSLDALVCAWVGTRFVEGATRALGDGSAAIWIPEARGA